MLQCPKCRTSIVRQARRRGLIERWISALTIYPLRCQLCAHRFVALIGQPSVNPRRDYERLFVRYPASFTHAMSTDPLQAVSGTMVNLCLKGCKIESPKVEQQGTVLTVTFQPTEGGLPIAVEGAVVRYTLADCMGLEFLSVEAEEEARLRQIIETRLHSRPR
jgi:hypothetical protein